MRHRIKEIRKESAEKTLEKFGEKIGISGPALSQIENGKTSPTPQTIKAICTFYNVNENWLRTGEGEKYVKLTPMETIMERLAAIKMTISNDPDSHAAEIAKFRERLAAAILNLNDEGCDLMINFIEDMGYIKKEEND